LRYKTTHERAFFRAFYALRAARKDKLREALDWKKFEEQMKELARKSFEKAASAQEAQADAKREPEETPAQDGKRSAQGSGMQQFKPPTLREARSSDRAAKLCAQAETPL
jgi:hypothetical protein